jgi:hypothetical protein
VFRFLWESEIGKIGINKTLTSPGIAALIALFLAHPTIYDISHSGYCDRSFGNIGG